MLSKKHIIGALLIMVIGFSAVIGRLFYNKIYKPNTTKDGIIYIPSEAKFSEVERLVRPYLKRTKSFRWVAKIKKYNKHIKPGRFEIKKGMSNNDLVVLLRNKPKPIRVTFNNQESLPKLAGRIAQQIEADSLSLLKAFYDEKFNTEHGFTKETALCLYLPDSYEMKWNSSAIEFQNKMLKAYKDYWNSSRLKKAKAQNLTPIEVSILASIVQKETAKTSERKTVAGLYLNRLNNKWPLQADPTVIFAQNLKAGKDLGIRRVYLKYLEIDSPYNTYKNQGLPPGPISMPDKSTIEAVLNPEKHDYFYMCASVSKPGSHVFAKTNAQHAVNSRKYQRWIATQGY